MTRRHGRRLPTCRLLYSVIVYCCSPRVPRFLVPCSRYSGKTLEATPWDGVPAIQEILAAVEAAASLGPGFFNCVLLNWYRDGKDNMGWHSGEINETKQNVSKLRRDYLRRQYNST